MGEAATQPRRCVEPALHASGTIACETHAPRCRPTACDTGEAIGESSVVGAIVSVRMHETVFSVWCTDSTDGDMRTRVVSQLHESVFGGGGSGGGRGGGGGYSLQWRFIAPWVAQKSSSSRDRPPSSAARRRDGQSTDDEQLRERLAAAEARAAAAEARAASMEKELLQLREMALKAQPASSPASSTAEGAGTPSAAA